jgi:hydroxypyruvate isomerase
MPRLAANLSMLWTELEPFERFRAAADAGFTHVEMLFPQELGDALRLERTLHGLGLEMVLFDPTAGDWSAGERGLLCLSGREEEFIATVSGAVDLAKRLGTRRLNSLVGIPPPGTPDELAERTALENIKRAADLVGAAGAVLLLEAVNNTDVPGYWAGTTARAAALVEAAAHPSVRLQLDQYHAGMAGEDALVSLELWRPLISHVQVADVPGRHQPGTGSQPIPTLLDDLDGHGYDGFVGLEYRPLGSTEASLEWARELLAPRA